jgi:hypothetical protein
MLKFNKNPLRLYLVAHGFNVPVLENVFQKEGDVLYTHPNLLDCIKLCFTKDYALSEIDFITLKNHYPKHSSEIFKIFVKSTFFRLKEYIKLFLIRKTGEIIFATLFIVASLSIFYVYKKGDAPINNLEVRLFSFIFLALFGLIAFAILRMYNAVTNNSKTIAGNYLATKKMLEDFTKKNKK